VHPVRAVLAAGASRAGAVSRRMAGFAAVPSPGHRRRGSVSPGMGHCDAAVPGRASAGLAEAGKHSTCFRELSLRALTGEFTRSHRSERCPLMCPSVPSGVFGIF